MKRIVLCVIFVQFLANVFSQTVHLSGKFINSETKQPIRNVNVFTKDNKTGTISTEKGKFTLDIPESKIKEYLYFTSIEYETDSVLIEKVHNPITVHLTPKIYVLNEVYIIPDSTLLTLLQKAYKRISENYPSQPTKYEGFFRHSVFDEKEDLIELIEAVLSVYKESYLKKKEIPGQISLLRSRKKQLQKNTHGFIGGAFAPISDDIVLQREKYINPDYFKNYKYKCVSIKNFDGKNCYEIEFYPLNKDSAKVQGHLLIDEKTLAYVTFEIHFENPENTKSILGFIPPIQSDIKINYIQQNEKWYLKQITIDNQYANLRLKNPLSSSLNYVTTSIQTDSVKPIPIKERLEYIDPIEAKTEEYTPLGWTDSDILSKENASKLGFQFSTDETAAIFQQKSVEETSFKKALLHIIPQIISGYGLSFDFNNQLFLNQVTIGYRFDKKWSIQWRTTEDFFVKNVKYTENELGIEFRKNINNAGYPLFLGTSLGIADSQFINKSESTKKQMIIPQLSLSKRTSRFFSFELFVNYPVVIHSNVSPNQEVNHCPRIGISMFLF